VKVTHTMPMIRIASGCPTAAGRVVLRAT
jgi:hypothetical protein